MRPKGKGFFQSNIDLTLERKFLPYICHPFHKMRPCTWSLETQKHLMPVLRLETYLKVFSWRSSVKWKYYMYFGCLAGFQHPGCNPNLDLCWPRGVANTL